MNNKNHQYQHQQKDIIKIIWMLNNGKFTTQQKSIDGGAINKQ